MKNPARKAKHKLDTRVSKIKAEVAKVEGYIKGSSALHDSSAPSSYPSSVVSGSEDERGERGEKWRENLSFSITKRDRQEHLNSKTEKPKLLQTQTAPSVVPQVRRPLPPIPTKDPLVIPGDKAKGVSDIKPERAIMVFPNVQKHATRAAHIAGEARRGLERAQSMEDMSRFRRWRPEPLREVLEADKRLNEILKTPPKMPRGGTFHPPKGLWKSFQLEFSASPTSTSSAFAHSAQTYTMSSDGRTPTPTMPDLIQTPTSTVSAPSPQIPQGFFLSPPPGQEGSGREQASYFSLPALSLAGLHKDELSTKSISPKEVLEMILPTTPILSHHPNHHPPFPLLRQSSQPGTSARPHRSQQQSHLQPPSRAQSIPRSATLPRNTRFSTQAPPPLPSHGSNADSTGSQHPSKRNLRLLNEKLPMLQTQ
jgi:hypothetical protein